MPEPRRLRFITVGIHRGGPTADRLIAELHKRLGEPRLLEHGPTFRRFAAPGDRLTSVRGAERLLDDIARDLVVDDWTDHITVN